MRLFAGPCRCQVGVGTWVPTLVAQRELIVLDRVDISMLCKPFYTPDIWRLNAL